MIAATHIVCCLLLNNIKWHIFAGLNAQQEVHTLVVMETELPSSGVPSMEFLSDLNLARHVFTARQKVASSVANSQHAFSVDIVLCYATVWLVSLGRTNCILCTELNDDQHNYFRGRAEVLQLSVN
jgi:hypothetical protein